jgi:hypothetical protein
MDMKYMTLAAAKVAAIQEAIDLIDEILADVYIEQLLKRVLESISWIRQKLLKHKRVVEYANELAQRDWQRLWRILKDRIGMNTSCSKIVTRIRKETFGPNGSMVPTSRSWWD